MNFQAFFTTIKIIYFEAAFRFRSSSKSLLTIQLPGSPSVFQFSPHAVLSTINLAATATLLSVTEIFAGKVIFTVLSFKVKLPLTRLFASGNSLFTEEES